VARPLIAWILYGGGCGFCFRWVHFSEKVVARRGFERKDLQSAEEEGISQIPAENLPDDIRVLKGDGGLECGADAYLFVAKQPSRSRCYSAYRRSIGCCGLAIVGSTGIAIAVRGFAGCQSGAS
jgi:predicted DCC family thiol-disulfide oxidoreductase YuxK